MALTFPPSSYKRWSTCTASPAATEGMSSEKSSSADEGLIAHELHAMCINLDMDPAEMIGEVIHVKDVGLSTITGEMADFVSASIRYILDQINPDWYVETELKLDLSFYHPGQKGYADVVSYDADKPFVVHMVDLKYGKGIKEYAERNGEVMIHALGVLHSLPSAKQRRVERFVIHISQPRLGHFDKWEITRADLKEFEKSIIDKVADATDEKRRQFVPTVEGCRYCQKKNNCRPLKESVFAKAVLGKNAFGGIDLIDPDTLSVSELVEMWEWLDFISAWCKNLKESMHKEALKGKQFPGLKLIAGTEGKREWKDEVLAEEKLRKLDFEDFEIFNQTLMTAPQAEKLLGKARFNEELKSLIKRAPAVPLLVKESDPGIPLNQARIDEFDD